MTTVVIPKVHPMMRKYLLGHTSVRSIAYDRVFAADRFPPDTELPAIRFKFDFQTPATEPAPVWWRMTGLVNCVADDESTADDLADAVLTALLQLEGTNQEGTVVQAVFDWGVQSVEDGAWAPPKPQRIVTVTITVRTA